MAFTRLPLLLVSFVLELSFSVGQENNDLSAVSYNLCEGSPENVNFKIKVRPKDRGDTLSARFKGKTRQKNLDGKVNGTI